MTGPPLARQPALARGNGVACVRRRQCHGDRWQPDNEAHHLPSRRRQFARRLRLLFLDVEALIRVTPHFFE
jgi:hypothetical protein